MNKVVIIIDSKADLTWAEEIAEAVDKLGVESLLRVASPRESPLGCYELITEHKEEDVAHVYPAIACPLYSGGFGGSDIYSSLVSLQERVKEYQKMARRR